MQTKETKQPYSLPCQGSGSTDSVGPKPVSRSFLTHGRRALIAQSARIGRYRALDTTVNVPLTQGKIATVSMMDYDRIRSYRWRAKFRDGIWYAISGRNGELALHRIILGVSDPAVRVDHKDGDGLNNTRENLRPATDAQNVRNSSLSKRNTVGFKGVTRLPQGGFRAQIMCARKKINLGKFPTPEDAAREYDRNARKLFGEFARCNFPEAC